MIYPAVGHSTREGHNLVYRSVATWQDDVFDFLDQHLTKSREPEAWPSQFER
jgi:hypothetical protein